jgi:Uma2 family endonuclease
MESAQSKKRHSPEEYLELEEKSLEKHQYFRGEILELFPASIAGAPEAHSLITANVIGEIRNPLKGGPCRVYDSNLRIPSLRQYVLISQVTARVESYLRQDDGTWVFSFASGLDAATQFGSLNIRLPLSEIYAAVVFPPSEGP